MLANNNQYVPIEIYFLPKYSVPQPTKVSLLLRLAEKAAQ